MGRWQRELRSHGGKSAEMVNFKIEGKPDVVFQKAGSTKK